MEKRHGPHPAQTVRRSSDRACRFLQSSGWGDRAAKNTRVDQSEAASSAGRPRPETSQEMAQVQAASRDARRDDRHKTHNDRTLQVAKACFQIAGRAELPTRPYVRTS